MAKTVLILSKSPQLTPVLQLACGDANSHTVELRVKRMFGGIDLSGLSWSVWYENANEETDIKVIGFYDHELGDYLVMYWTTSALVASAAGNTVFRVQGVEGDNIVWSSTDYTIRVDKTEFMEEPEHPEDALTELQTIIRDLPTVYDAKDAADEAASAALEAAENAASAAELANSAAEEAQNAASDAEARVEAATQSIIDAGSSFVEQANAAADSALAYKESVAKNAALAQQYATEAKEYAETADSAQNAVAENAAIAAEAKEAALDAKNQAAEILDRIGDIESGIDGGYYIPSVDENGILSWTPSSSDMDSLPTFNIKGTPGSNGADGVTFTPHLDANGILSWTANREGVPVPPPTKIVGGDGEPGADGADGAPGAVYTPHVDEDGNLTWTSSDPTLPPIPTVNIKGKDGDGADIIVDSSLDPSSQNPVKNSVIANAFESIHDEVDSMVRIDTDSTREYIDVLTVEDLEEWSRLHSLAGELKLVEDIPDWDGTASIVRNIDTEGTAYNFSKIYIVFNMAPGSGSMPIIVRCGHTSPLFCARANIPSGVNNNARYSYAEFDYDSTRGAYTAKFSGGIALANDSSYASVYTNIEYKATQPFSYLQISGNNNYPRSGNSVKIYGVRL